MRSRMLRGLLFLTTVALLALPQALLRAEDPASPSAHDVILRGKQSLADALRAATRKAWDDGAKRAVAIVVDVTPYTARWGEILVEALMSLEADAGDRASWRIAPIGGSFGPEVDQPSHLAMQLDGVLASETDDVNTTEALRRTLRGFRERDGVVVYLADWRFEDDQGIEQLLASLRGAGQTFSTIGSEAAFARGWNDGLSGLLLDDYPPDIGRDPFGNDDPDAPWHGGDTAYPHVPSHFDGVHWQTEFHPQRDLSRLVGDRGRRRGEPDSALEDLRERLREEVEPHEDRFLRHPLPSAFGPHGLMRVAARTGGRYVLWSWNPNGRSNVKYDYAQCELFPPDLRSRNAIRADVARRPLAAALIKAWHTTSQRDVGIVAVTPPLATDLRGAREMDRPQPNQHLATTWRTEEQHRDFVRNVPDVLDALDEALDQLDRAITKTPARPDAVDARYLADAHLFRHELRVQRFSLGEALFVARDVPADWWGDEERSPGLQPVVYLEQGRDPDRVRARSEPRNETERGAQLVADRRMMLERYRGTPFGELVARNDVSTYSLTRVRMLDPSDFDASRTPAESSGEPPDPTPTGGTPGGGSTGGGPATGR